MFSMFLIVAAVTAAARASDVSIHEPTKELTSACDKADHIKHMSKQIATIIADQATEIATAEQDAAKVAVATAKATGTSKATFEAIAVAVSSSVTAAKAKMQTALTAAFDAAAAASALAGQQALIADLEKTIIQTKAWALADTFVTDNGHAIVVQTKAGRGGECQATSTEGRTTTTKSRDYATEIQIHFDHITPAPAVPGGASGVRICGDGACAGENCNAADETATQLYLQQGKVFTKHQQTYKRTPAAGDAYAAAGGKNSDLIPPTADVQLKLTAIKILEDQLKDLNFKATSVRSFTITGTTLFREMVAQAFVKNVQPGKLDNHKDAIDKAIKEMYGDTAENFKTKIWETIDETTVAGWLAGKQSDEKLSNIKNLGQLRAAAGFYSIEAATAQAAASPTIKMADQSTCETRSKDECRKDNKCEWKGSEKEGKCETKGEKGVKAAEKKEKNVKIRKRMHAKKILAASGRIMLERIPVFS
uniref:Variant surface glycoprotein 1125.4569 n=1 Tax=Trypanosoma brucei TaxID=5691 RepID=A0A1J0RAJ3_9TRYP|nr:variant surface glycoprotein 1125.4569 [Trypanosoma brucei]